MNSLVWMVLALPASAVADPANKVTLTGHEARALALGLKLSGVTLVKVADDGVLAATKVSCTTTDGGVLEDGLASTSCQLESGNPLAAAPSQVLRDALVSTLGTKGLPSDDHMSKTTITVASIYCKIGPDAKAPKVDDRFTCDVGLRQPGMILVTPKKRKVKDIVQPVKIEKQEME